MAAQHFGQFILDSNSVLSRDGDTIHVPPKELQLLNILLRHQGRVVSLESIEKEIWPRQQVSYASIARCVYELRKILGDRDRTIVESVPKRGYKFGLPVCQSAPERLGSTSIKIAQADPRAYADFIEGQRYANTGSVEGMRRAKRLFESALRADSDFAAARAALGDCLIYESIRGYIYPNQAMKLGLTLSEKAVEIDSHLASAHAVRGWIHGVAIDIAEGLASLETALSLDPGYARGFTYLSFVQCAAGLVEECVASARHAVELDPHSVLNKHALVWRLFCSGKPDEALNLQQRNIADFPDDQVALAMYGVIAAWMGSRNESLEATERAVRTSGENPMVMTTRAYALARAGRDDQARALADDLINEDLPRACRPHVAMTFVQLGEHARAIELLREARDEKCPWFRIARFDPRLEALGTDSRLLALFEGLP